MADISIIEFGVFGFFAYSSMLMLIISLIKPVMFTESAAIARSIYLIPGIVCAFILAGSGINITLETVYVENLTNATATNSTIFIEEAVTTSSYVLLNPVWGAVHNMIGLVMVLYVVQQILQLLGFWPDKLRR